MDITKRYISKIAREALRFARLSLLGTNLGTSECECLHYVRKNKGISQEKLSNLLSIDKAAVTRMVVNLERKGYLYRLQDENDKRAKKLFATDKAVNMKNTTSSAESFFYEWLLEDIKADEKEVFLNVLKDLYLKSKKERQEHFANIRKKEVSDDGKVED